MNNQKWFKIANIVACVLMLGYLFSAIYSRISNNYKTQTAYVTTVSESTDAEMFIIRSEKEIESNSKGSIVVPLAVNGGRVSNGSEIAALFSDEQSAENYSSIISLKEKLAVYEKIDSQVRLANLDLDNLSDDINTEFYSMLNAVYENDFSTLVDDEMSFDEKLSRKNISLDKEVDCNAKIIELQSKIESLSKSVPNSIITATSSGYYVSRLDGYEDVLTVDDIDSLTPEMLEDAFKAEKKEVSSSSIGKIINGYNWYIATYTSSSAITGLSKGTKVKLVLGDNSDETVTAKVYSNTVYDTDSALTIFKCSFMNEELCNLRKVTGKIITGSYKGIKIKKDAIRFDEDGNEGVYIKEGNVVRFNLIEELYSKDNYVIAADKTGTAGMLAKYDEIVVSGKELSNGKVLD